MVGNLVVTAGSNCGRVIRLRPSVAAAGASERGGKPGKVVREWEVRRGGWDVVIMIVWTNKWTD